MVAEGRASADPTDTSRIDGDVTGFIKDYDWWMFLRLTDLERLEREPQHW